jgi:hypothetical protein
VVEIGFQMNDVLAMPIDLTALNVGEMLALPNVQSGQRVKRLSATAEQLVSSIASVMDDLVSVTIERRTAADFLATRNDVFPHYFQAVRALTDLARIIVPQHVLQVLTLESFTEMEAEFRDQGLEAFGQAVRDQALFTVWTLRKISDLCQRIGNAKLNPGFKESDAEMFANFVSHAVGARFHLDCLLKSMIVQKPMHPDVLSVVIDGLRNAVNAYAWARRAFDLRVPRTEQENVTVEWDEEDRQLLNEATFDMVTDPA